MSSSDSTNGMIRKTVPDPSVLTTQQLQREIQLFKEVVDSRFTAMDKAVSLLQDTANGSPTSKEVFIKHEQMFDNIKTQFTERDTRTEQTSKDSKVAVDAALQAAKEAVGAQNESNSLAIAKSEAATMKQIDSMGALIAATAKTSDEKIDDLKGRLGSIEGRTTGHSEFWGFVVGGVGLLAGVISMIFLLSHMAIK